MGSRKYTGRRGPKILASFLKARRCGISVLLLWAWLNFLLLAGPQTTHAQPPVPPRLNNLPKNHQLPLTGGLIDDFDGNYNQQPVGDTNFSPKRRRTIPTLRARYRPQDGDLFGEGQAKPKNSARGSIFDAPKDGPQPPAKKPPARRNPFGEPTEGNLFGKPKDGPQPPAKKPPARRNPFGEPNQDNLFGEPKNRTPFDPSPREPVMDTKREQPTPRRSKNRNTNQSRDGLPKLPDGSEYTPDSKSIPELPMPDGGTRSTEKAGRVPDKRRGSSILTVPDDDISEEIEKLEKELDRLDLIDPRDREEIDKLERELDSLDLIDPRDRSPRSNESSRRQRRTSDREEEDFRRRQTGSNVYRPARDPSYYSRPTGYGSSTFGQYPQAYDPNSAYGAYPQVAPKDMELIVQDAVRHAMSNYAANPANPAVAPYYGRGYACPPCPPCLQASASPEVGGGPRGGQVFPTDPAASLSQQFTQPSSSSCPPAVANEVYEGVVCGDQEIDSHGPTGFPRKATGLSIGGLGLGAVRNYGPNIYYGSIFGGWVGLDDLMLSGDEGQIQIGNEGGFAGGLALGKIQGKNLRSELEVTYRGNDLTSMTLNNLAGSTQLLEGDGRIDTVSGMLNVIWDFTDFPTQRFKPYLGAGFGGISANADFQIDGQSTLGDGNDTSLAYQWIAGINFQTRSQSDFFVEYRYFAADSLHFNTTLPAGALIDGDGELEYRTSNVLFGFRMKF